MSTQPPQFENADKCRKCNTGFSLFTRKHHCRNCGRTFCQDHSSGTLSLPHFGIMEGVRVCGECEQKIKAGFYRAAPPKSAAAPVAEQKEPAFVAPPPKKVKNCTCNSPLCICVPDPDEKPVESKSTASTAAPAARKPTPAPASSTSSLSGPTPVFLGFGSASKQKQVWNLNGDLNEQVREAVKAQDIDGVKLLLGAGADAKYIDRTGNSLAHLAAMFNRYDIIELLAGAGANLWLKNPSRETPVDLAPPALQRKMKELQPQTQ